MISLSCLKNCNRDYTMKSIILAHNRYVNTIPMFALGVVIMVINFKSLIPLDLEMFWTKNDNLVVVLKRKTTADKWRQKKTNRSPESLIWHIAIDICPLNIFNFLKTAWQIVSKSCIFRDWVIGKFHYFCSTGTLGTGPYPSSPAEVVWSAPLEERCGSETLG